MEKFQKVINSKALFILILLIALFSIIGYKLYELQITQAAALVEESEQSINTTKIIKATRGDILDRNGQKLATTINKYNLFVDQKSIDQNFQPDYCDLNDDDEEEFCAQNINEYQKPGLIIARVLSPIVDIPYEDLSQSIISIDPDIGLNGHKVIAENLSLEIKEAIEDLGIANLIGLDIKQTRKYPGDDLASLLIGNIALNGFPDPTNTTVTNYGLAGLEYQYDEELKGTDGKFIYQTANNGQVIPTEETYEIPAIDGKSIQTTIDAHVQRRAQELIDEGTKEFDAGWGIAIVQEIKTGKILAIADSGEPDLNTYSKTLKPSKAIATVFSPGSIQKPITAASLINEGLASPTTAYTIGFGSAMVGGQTISDLARGGGTNLTLAGILAYSSNIGIITAGQAQPIDTRWAYLDKFKYFQPTGIELPGENEGFAPEPINCKGWDAEGICLGLDYENPDYDDSSDERHMMGEAISVNALQMVRNFSTFGNNGKMMKPTIIEAISQDDGTFSQIPIEEGEQVISESTAQDVCLMLETVVEEGVVKSFVHGKWRIGGKSGTNDSLNEVRISSFIGVAPIDDPQYTIGVFYNNPQNGEFGAPTAGYTMAQLMNFVLEQNNVPVSSYSTTYYPANW